MTQIIHSPDDSPAALVAADDRQWFEDHPGRFIRLRYATDGDRDPVTSEPLPTGEVVIVFCPHDGIRWRLRVQLTADSVLHQFLAGRLHADADLTVALLEGLEQARAAMGDVRIDALQMKVARCVINGGRLDGWEFP